jgi:hypothetical protein
MRRRCRFLQVPASVLHHRSHGEGGSLSRSYGYSPFPMKEAGSASALRLLFLSGKEVNGLLSPWTLTPPRSAWVSWNCLLLQAADICNESSLFWFWISYEYVRNRPVIFQIKPGIAAPDKIETRLPSEYSLSPRNYHTTTRYLHVG